MIMYNFMVMLNKSVLNYYSHFSSLFPDFFPAIVFYSSRRIVSDKKNHVTLKNNMFLWSFHVKWADFHKSPRTLSSDLVQFFLVGCPIIQIQNVSFLLQIVFQLKLFPWHMVGPVSEQKSRMV